MMAGHTSASSTCTRCLVVLVDVLAPVSELDQLAERMMPPRATVHQVVAAPLTVRVGSNQPRLLGIADAACPSGYRRTRCSPTATTSGPGWLGAGR